jgi:hypothetical protein
VTRFTYNDIVRIKPCANADGRSGQKAWVVAVLEVKEDIPKGFEFGPIYTVEFEDGQAIDVHEGMLEAFG